MINHVKVKQVETYKDSQGEHLVCKGKLIMIDSVKAIIISPLEQQDSLEKGDKILFTGSDGYREIYEYIKDEGFCMGAYNSYRVRCTIAYSKTAKILATSENLSPKHIQAMLNGKLSNGDEVYIECDNELLNKKGGCTAYELSKEWDKGVAPDSFIKLTNNHIKLFPVDNNDQLWDKIFNKHKTFGAFELKQLLKKHYKAPEELNSFTIEDNDDFCKCNLTKDYFDEKNNCTICGKMRDPKEN